MINFTSSLLIGAICFVKYFVVGNLAAEIGKVLEQNGFEVKYFDNNEQAANEIVKICSNGETVFLKASRSMEFEKIIENIRGKI